MGHSVPKPLNRCSDLCTSCAPYFVVFGLPYINTRGHRSLTAGLGGSMEWNVCKLQISFNKNHFRCRNYCLKYLYLIDISPRLMNFISRGSGGSCFLQFPEFRVGGRECEWAPHLSLPLPGVLVMPPTEGMSTGPVSS